MSPVTIAARSDPPTPTFPRVREERLQTDPVRYRAYGTITVHANSESRDDPTLEPMVVETVEGGHLSPVVVFTPEDGSTHSSETVSSPREVRPPRVLTPLVPYLFLTQPPREEYQGKEVGGYSVSTNQPRLDSLRTKGDSSPLFCIVEG